MVFKIQLFTQKRCDVKIRNVQKTKVPSSSIIFKKKGDVSINDISKALRCITSTAGKRELSLQILCQKKKNPLELEWQRTLNSLLHLS